MGASRSPPVPSAAAALAVELANGAKAETLACNLPARRTFRMVEFSRHRGAPTSPPEDKAALGDHDGDLLCRHNSPPSAFEGSAPRAEDERGLAKRQLIRDVLSVRGRGKIGTREEDLPPLLAT